MSLGGVAVGGGAVTALRECNCSNKRAMVSVNCLWSFVKVITVCLSVLMAGRSKSPLGKPCDVCGRVRKGMNCNRLGAWMK